MHISNKIAHLIIATFIFTPPASAATTYLNCKIGSNPDHSAMLVQLNEEAGTATWTFPDTGKTYTEPAQFGNDKVVFFKFTINRLDLTIERTFYELTDRGVCALDKRKRAF